MEGEDEVGTLHTRLSIGLRKIAHYVMNQRLCMNGNKMKSGSTFKIPRNVGGNGYWSILIPRLPNQVMTLKCAVMCVPLQYKPSVHHQMSRILSMNLLSPQFLIWRMTNEWTTPVISRMISSMMKHPLKYILLN